MSKNFLSMPMKSNVNNTIQKAIHQKKKKVSILPMFSQQLRLLFFFLLPLNYYSHQGQTGLTYFIRFLCSSFISFLNLFYAYGFLPAFMDMQHPYVCTCTMFMPIDWEGQRERQIATSHGVGNQTQAICKSNKCSKRPNHISSLSPWFLSLSQ